MIKTSVKKLKNGLTVVCVEDKSKNMSEAELLVKYGSEIKNIKIDGHIYEIRNGLAHLLEHSLIEGSSYGNVLSFFRRDYVYVNGFTSRKYTYYPIETVKDFKKYLEILIRFVNIASFTDEDLKNIKGPVIDEIIRGKDRSYRKLAEKVNELVCDKTKYINNLGEKEDIDNITVEDLKLVHDVFYQPQNEILSLSGNFDTDEIIKYIEDIYDKINFEKHDVEVLDMSDTLELAEKNVLINDEQYSPLAEILYKIDISKFTNEELLKIDYYLSFLLNSCFSDNSNTYKKIVDNNYSSFSINFSRNRINRNVLMLEVSILTKNYEEVWSIFDDALNIKILDKDYFYLWKRRELIDRIEPLKKASFLRSDLVGNILRFDIDKFDTLEFIDNLNYEECIELLSRLSFDNKTYIKQVKNVKE